MLGKKNIKKKLKNWSNYMQCLPTYFWGLSSSEEETVIQSS